MISPQGVFQHLPGLGTLLAIKCYLTKVLRAAELYRGDQVMQEAQSAVGRGAGANASAASSGRGAAQPAVFLHLTEAGGAHDGGGDHIQGLYM